VIAQGRDPVVSIGARIRLPRSEQRRIRSGAWVMDENALCYESVAGLAARTGVASSVRCG